MANNSWYQISARAKELKQQALGGNDGTPFIASIRAVSSKFETMSIEHYGGSRKIKILHPYLGLNAWHRVGPEPGMGLLLQNRRDSKEPEASIYYVAKDRNISVPARTASFEEGKDAYRPLEPGEQDLSAKGLAQLYMARRPIMDYRAGFVRAWLDQDALEAGVKSATHKRVLHKNSTNSLGDEERFGVVTRPQKKSGSNSKSYVNTDFIVSPASSTGTSTGFAKEYYRSLASGSGKPVFLVEHQEGDVFNSDGKTITGEFGTNLRLRNRLFSTEDKPLETQVDVNGNLSMKLPDDATQGVRMVIPKGNFDGVQQGDNVFYKWKTSGSYEVNAQKEIKIESTQSTTKVYGTKVRLGDNTSSEPLVLGNTYRDAEKQLFDKLKQFADADATAFGAANDALNGINGAVQAIQALPLVPGAVIGPLLNLIMRTLTTLFNANKQLASQRKASYETFNNSYDSYLSKVVKTT